MARPFLTVPDELLYHAENAADYFEARGYTVTPEHHDLGFPYAPTLYCERPPTTLFVEVDSAIRKDRTNAWVGYTRSCSGDTRIALAMPTENPRATTDEAWLRTAGVGLYLCNAGPVQESIPPRDMSLNAQLPELASLPPEIRRILGPVYEQFERAQWRDGFKSACQAVESLAREYLKQSIRAGRIAFVTAAGRPRPLTEQQIDGMTLGQLGQTFGQIQNQNYSDSAIGSVLRLINKDRVNITHHSTRPETEAALRQNVGQHMYRVIAALKELT